MSNIATISLSNDDWTVHAVGNIAKIPDNVQGESFPAQVPGCVHTDLMRAGVVEDPNLGFAEEAQSWVGQCDWEYQTTFILPDDPTERSSLFLRCDGLDTAAIIKLNGDAIGEAENMFHPHCYPIHKAALAGRNELNIRFRSPVRHVREREAKLGWRPVNGDWTPYPFIRKMACNFGWDWGPKVPTVGICGDLRIEACDAPRIEHIRPLIHRTENDSWRVDVHVDLFHACENSDSVSPSINAKQALVLRTTLRDSEGRTIITQEADSSKIISLDVTSPKLWWPAGYGEQHMYDLSVELLTADKPRSQKNALHTLDARRTRIGFRTITIDTEPDALGSPFSFIINDKPIFAKGANWIPPTLFSTDVTRDLYAQLLTAARDANMNMIRVWGGGFYPHDRFYELCDELGLMVWQDFMFACATYPEEEPYFSSVEKEARHQVARLTGHPSVVLWCGGNECVWAHHGWGFKEKLAENQTWGERFYHELLPAVCEQLDSTTPYWPNTPYSGEPDTDPIDPDRGTRHTWDRRIEEYREIVPRFVAEFGHQSPPNLSTLTAALPPNELQIDSRAMVHRQRATAGNGVQFQEPLSEWFAPPTSFNEWHFLAQLMQARALSIGLQWLRAHSPRCMGALLWQLNDCWAGHSWAIVDHLGRRKLAYHAVRHSFEPRLLTIQPIGEIPTLFAVNDTNDVWSTRITAQRRTLSGETLAKQYFAFDVPPQSVYAILNLQDALGLPTKRNSELLHCDIGEQRATWLFNKDKELSLPRPAYDLRFIPDKCKPRFEITAHSIILDAALLVDRVLPGADVSEQLFTLMPNETKSVNLRIPKGTSLDKETIQTLTQPSLLVCANSFSATRN